MRIDFRHHIRVSRDFVDEFNYVRRFIRKSRGKAHPSLISEQELEQIAIASKRYATV
jgi:hypothetical protein